MDLVKTIDEEDNPEDLSEDSASDDEVCNLCTETELFIFIFHVDMFLTIIFVFYFSFSLQGNV